MKIVLPILAFFFLLSCERGSNKSYTSEKYLRGLRSCKPDSICVSSYYFGEQRDSAAVVDLLNGILDQRITHHVNHLGMTAYYCKAGALNKISGFKIVLDQDGEPDIQIAKQFLSWAIENNLVKDSTEIDFNKCNK